MLYPKITSLYLKDLIMQNKILELLEKIYKDYIYNLRVRNNYKIQKIETTKTNIDMCDYIKM